MVFLNTKANVVTNAEKIDIWGFRAIIKGEQCDAISWGKPQGVASFLQKPNRFERN